MASRGDIKVSYRRPQAQDLARLTEIYNYAIRETAATLDTEEETPDHFKRWVPGDDLYRMLVAEVEDEVVAYAGTCPYFILKAYSQTAKVLVYVHPAWQRQGVGSALLHEIHNGEFLAGLHTVIVMINKNNTHSSRIFEKLGYTYKGEMTDVGIKFGKFHSLALYQKEVRKSQAAAEDEGISSSISVTQRLHIHRPDLTYYHDLYRTIHQEPELSRQEPETANRVAKSLRRFADICVKEAVGGHGVVGVLQNGAGPTVLLRAELDALPIKEETGWDFASVKQVIHQVDGVTKPVMHACGHDLHMVALLLAVETLYACRRHWRGTLIALFQPDEETGGGAKQMVDEGLYDVTKHGVPKPDVVLGGHCMPMRAGRISTRSGVFNSAVDVLQVTIYGRGGHSARPHTTVDPVVLASSIVMKLQTIISRQVNPLESAVVTVGSIQAGTTANVISDKAVLQINTRALSANSRTRLMSSLERMIRAECAAMESPKEPLFEWISSFPLLENDEGLTKVIAKAFRGHFGEAFDTDAPVSMGGEDMAHLATAVQAPSHFWTFGCIDPKVWDDAEARGTLSMDVHGEFFFFFWSHSQLGFLSVMMFFFGFFCYF